MSAEATEQLRQAIESQHGGTATFVRSIPIHESFRGRTIWNGAVQLFDLTDSPSGAVRVYAWSTGLPDGRRTFFAVLHAGDVTGPREAVKATLATAGGTTG